MFVLYIKTFFTISESIKFPLNHYKPVPNVSLVLLYILDREAEVLYTVVWIYQANDQTAFFLK